MNHTFSPSGASPLMVPHSSVWGWCTRLLPGSTRRCPSGSHHGGPCVRAVLLFLPIPQPCQNICFSLCLPVPEHRSPKRPGAAMRWNPLARWLCPLGRVDPQGARTSSHTEPRVAQRWKTFPSESLGGIVGWGHSCLSVVPSKMEKE